MRRMCSRTTCCAVKIGGNYGRIQAVGDVIYVDKLQLTMDLSCRGKAAPNSERPERCRASNVSLPVLEMMNKVE